MLCAITTALECAVAGQVTEHCGISALLSSLLLSARDKIVSEARGKGRSYLEMLFAQERVMAHVSTRRNGE
jgi:hypothetical protein